MLNINFRSAIGERGGGAGEAEINHLIQSTKPDIIIGTEAWLD